jgi:hypothetical protein
LELTNVRLKKLYRELEDIWNYRAGLTPHTKGNIVPPNGRLCSVPVEQYNHCNSQIELQEILVSEVSKVLGARTLGDMNLGFMYFIIALSIVNPNCFIVHQGWVQHVF